VWQGLEGAMEAKLALPGVVLQSDDKLAPKKLSEHRDGKKEASVALLAPQLLINAIKQRQARDVGKLPRTGLGRKEVLGKRLWRVTSTSSRPLDHVVSVDGVRGNHPESQQRTCTAASACFWRACDH